MQPLARQVVRVAQGRLRLAAAMRVRPQQGSVAARRAPASVRLQVAAAQARAVRVRVRVVAVRRPMSMMPELRTLRQLVAAAPEVFR
jgi:hypothetical protein